jgi:hypothetical protein
MTNKHFIFEAKTIDGKLSFRSECEGFNALEILGFFDWKKDCCRTCQKHRTT